MESRWSSCGSRRRRPRRRTGRWRRQPRKYKGPQPDAAGVSPPDDGVPIAPVVPVALQLTSSLTGGRVDGRGNEVALGRGRAVRRRRIEGMDAGMGGQRAGEVVRLGGRVPAHDRLRGSQTAERSERESQGGRRHRRVPAAAAEAVRDVKAVDPKARTVTLLVDGEKEAKVWPLEPDAEVKVGGWWGRLEQFQPGDRVWVWLKLDRKKNPVSVVMLADEVSEFDMHGSLRKKAGEKPKFTAEQIEAKRCSRKRGCASVGRRRAARHADVPSTSSAANWKWPSTTRRCAGAARSVAGDTVHLTADPPIKGVVKAVTPWRERTVVRLVVGELESSELKIGQRLA